MLSRTESKQASLDIMYDFDGGRFTLRQIRKSMVSILKYLKSSAFAYPRRIQCTNLFPAVMRWLFSPCHVLLYLLSACQQEELRRESTDKRVIIPGLAIKNGSCAAELYEGLATHRYNPALEFRRAAQGRKRSWPQRDAHSNRPLLAYKGVIKSLLCYRSGLR